MRCSHEPAVEIVSPLMIRADDGTAADHSALHRKSRNTRTRLLAQAGAAMAAHIIKGAQHALAVAHQQHALAENVQDAVVARGCELFLARHAQPLAAEDPLALLEEDADVTKSATKRWPGF